jgi:hypothetical protein
MQNVKYPMQSAKWLGIIAGRQLREFCILTFAFFILHSPVGPWPFAPGRCGLERVQGTDFNPFRRDLLRIDWNNPALPQIVESD